MLDWLYPQTVEVINSKINGEIKITKSRGQYSVWVNKFEQSGPLYVEGVWKKALKGVSLAKQGDSLINVLVLGLGCGTMVPIILDKWPNAKITGVEIDHVMIELGKKYFGLSQISNLQIIQQDAHKFVKSTKRKFDLILVDAYIGNKRRNIPVPKKLLRRGGLMIANNLVGLKSEMVVKSTDV